MEDFLYILIGIAWLGWTLYSNKRKMDMKRAAQNQRSEETIEQPRPARSVFEELFDEREVLDEQQPQSYEAPNQESSWDKRATFEEAESLELITEEVPEDYFARQYRTGYRIEPVVEIIDEEVAKEEEKQPVINDDFDLRRAVIYSEILKTPYI